MNVFTNASISVRGSPLILKIRSLLNAQCGEMFELHADCSGALYLIRRDNWNNFRRTCKLRNGFILKPVL